MPILPLLLLLGQTTTPKDVVMRYSAYVKAHPTLSLKLKVKSNVPAYDGGSGSITLSPAGTRIDLTAPGASYLLVMNGTNGFEAVPAAKAYAEFEGAAGLGKVPLRLAENMSNFNIEPILMGVIGRSGWTMGPHAPGSDEIKSHSEGIEGKLDVEVNVDAEGRVLRIKATHSSTAHPAPQWVETTFSSYSPSAVPDSLFSIDPPVGWTAIGLRMASTPIQPREGYPNGPLLDPSGKSSTFKEMLGGQAVVALLDPEWAATPFGAEVITRVEAEFKSAGIPMVKLVDTAGQKEQGYWTDPSGSVLQGLNLPGSPCFCLFDAKGKLKQAFFAASPREPEQLYKDIAHCLKDAAEK